MSSIKDLDVGAGSEYFLKTPPGTTKIRLVSSPIRIWKDFDSKKLYLTEDGAKTNPEAKLRWACWAIDRADGQTKLWETSSGVIRDIVALANNPEYTFEGDLMPYDLLINRVGTTLNDTRYSVSPARQNVPLTEIETKTVEAQQALILFLRESAEDRDMVPII